MLIYLEDILVFSKNHDVHMADLQQVLTLLLDVGVTLKVKKWSLLAETTNYLGHIIQPGRLELSEAATAPVCELEDPTTQKELRSFLAFVPWYANFSKPLGSGSTVEYETTKRPAYDIPHPF